MRLGSISNTATPLCTWTIISNETINELTNQAILCETSHYFNDKHYLLYFKCRKKLNRAGNQN